MAGKVPKSGPEKAKPARVRYATYLPEAVVESIRRAAFQLRLSTGEVVEAAVVEYISKAEKKHGKAFGPIPGLRPGRPLRGE